MVTNDNIATNSMVIGSKDNITFINMPISSASEDKIGISQHVSELKTVIKKGAQSIAVTSDFGGGKSSLIRYLESEYSAFNTKFCYVNLWSQMNKSDSKDLHKSFIYQFASQINVRRGNYVSRRLSKNYGMFGVTFPSVGATLFAFAIFLFSVFGFICTTFYDEISKLVDIQFYNNHHEKIGVLSFVIAIFLAIFFIYKTDIIFSSKSSENNREIDEHELMDIYKTHICKFHFKHYIVVIEDLDRSENEKVNQFIKELRRYYIPCKRKRSKYAFVNWINDNILRNINRTTFIVNIKSEKEIAAENDKDLYSKAFDYVLNLKEINIDNYDVILKKLLEDNRNLFEKNKIPAFGKDDKFIPEFEWIIRGKKIGLREIKTRLSLAISTYVNLCSKFNSEYISLSKCIAAAYVLTAFEKEYTEIKDIGFDSIIDLYVSNPNMTEDDVSNCFEKTEKNVKISKVFAEDIKTLINNGLISMDYRQYFFNFPSDSYLHSDKQNRLINIILYDEDVSENADFPGLAKAVIELDKSIVIETFDRLIRLGKYFPDCIFYSRELFDIALDYNKENLCATLGEKLQYDSESISATAKIITNIIKHNLINIKEHTHMICNIISEKAPARSIVVFRKILIENFYENILKFKSLYFNDCPLITKAEVDSLKENTALLDLINFKSSELTIELVETIHISILTGFNLSDKSTLEKVADFYEKIFEVLGATEKITLTKFLFEICVKSKCINSKIEEIIIKNNKANDIIDSYVNTINLVDKHGTISENTLKYISDLKICQGLSESVCTKLQFAGFYRDFVINAYATQIDMINFNDENILNTIKDIDFLDEEDETVSLQLLLDVRNHILKQSKVVDVKKYQFLFMTPCPLIRASEINSINNRIESLRFIDASQINNDATTYLAEYLCTNTLSLNDSYEILCFVCSVDKKEVKQKFFMELNFDKIQYYRIAAYRKNHIIDLMNDVFNFEDISEQITYMTQTKCSNNTFEKNIKKAISEKKFDKHEEKYADYVRVAKQINNEMVNNLCALKSIYKMPVNVLEKLYSSKKYTYYVSSKTQYYGRFIFERHRLDCLDNAYEQIFLSEEGSYSNTKRKMSENREFVSYMRDKQAYVGATEHNRRLFANCQQTKHALKDLFENYNNKFIIEYLEISQGFFDEEAASYFVEKIKENTTVAAAESVYNNNHERLINSWLKSNFTRYHNKAKKG